jgi:hypothetical protein
MSDEPERVFSIAGNTLNPRRCVMTGDTVQELLCLRSWQRSGLVQFDHTMFEKAVQASQDAPIADELAYNNTIDLSIEGDDDSRDRCCIITYIRPPRPLQKHEFSTFLHLRLLPQVLYHPQGDGPQGLGRVGKDGKVLARIPHLCDNKDDLRLYYLGKDETSSSFLILACAHLWQYHHPA